MATERYSISDGRTIDPTGCEDGWRDNTSSKGGKSNPTNSRGGTNRTTNTRPRKKSTTPTTMIQMPISLEDQLMLHKHHIDIQLGENS